MVSPSLRGTVERDKNARAQLQRLVGQLYAAIEKGDFRSAESLFTSDALVFGLEPADTWQGAMVIVERAQQQLMSVKNSQVQLHIEESKVEVGLSEGATSAWAYDIPRVSVRARQETKQWLPRVSAHFVLESSGWKIDALHVSLAVPDEVVLSPALSKRLLAPADVAQKINSGAEVLHEQLRRVLGDFGYKVGRTARQPEFVQIGTALGEFFVGGAQFQQMIRPQLGAVQKAGYRWQLEGNVRVELAPDGQSGWAAAVVIQSLGEGKRSKMYPPLRFFWTWTRQDNEWWLSSEHQSLPLNLNQVSAASERDIAIWNSLREGPSRAGKFGIGVW